MGKYDDHEILGKIKTIVEGDPHIHGLGVAYAPYAYKKEVRLHAPYYSRRETAPELSRIESYYDYTLPEHEWFSLPMNQGALWIEPYFGTAGATLMTTYSVPFSKTDPVTKKQVFGGVVALDISLTQIKKIVESIDLGSGGYSAIMSKQGVYLYHPNYEFVRNRKTVWDVSKTFHDRDRFIAAERTVRGESGIMDHKSTTTGQLSWLLYRPIPSASWSIHTTFIKDDIPIDLDVLRHKLIRIVTLSIVFLLTLLCLVCGVQKGIEGKLWVACFVSSLIFVAGIGCLWHLALSYDTDLKSQGPKIVSRASLLNFTNSYDLNSRETRANRPLYVPTGMFIHSMEFSGANKLAVNGYIWQKYPSNLDREYAMGFVLPDAVDEVRVKEIYSRKLDDMNVLGWHFSGTLYQHFDYSKYPVDHEVIRIRLAPKEIGRNTVLVPDLDSYKLMNPGFRPGLEKTFDLPDWKIERTFFELVSKDYDTNFGIKNYLGRDMIPELYFNVAIVRNLMDAFIRNMTPLIIVALLLFAVMFISTEERMSRKFSMDIGENLVFVGSMFFVLIFAHISTRGRIPTQEIFYLEYFYLTMYVALLWVPISSILFVTGSTKFHVQYKENLISKLLYWPVILGALYVLTVATFF
jgi:hypothetical protein